MSVNIVVKDMGLDYAIRGGGRKGGKLTALDGVSLEVKQGEFLSVVGPSGCGKSTLLYILAGLIRKSRGTVLINGREITGPALDRGIVMQGYALFPWRTVQRNVEFGLEVKGTPKAARRRKALEYLESVGLSDFAQRYPYELSGGMKQRVAIVRALAYDPDILLMDEPFAAVDEQTREMLHEELLRIWEATHKTIIFVTHSIDEAVFLSDRVAVMSAGPGAIKRIIDVNLRRPRAGGAVKASVDFSVLRNRVWRLLQNMPDSEREGAAPADSDISDVISDSATL
ncbi:MAG: ABC transporter ATP-binding protein [Clostridiales Family XIII bacterium]|jgi:NitT/TauT family transport system ATP-binding protein|nr:ABC transporter ATP-binding protein [Clostridiales Family XIII bacterium]